VNGGHETLEDLEVVVDDFSDWCQAVGGAAGVWNDVHRRLIHNAESFEGLLQRYFILTGVGFEPTNFHVTEHGMLNVPTDPRVKSLLTR